MPWTATGSSTAAVAAARPEREPGRRPETRGLDKDKAPPRADAATPLTFYQELTAPLVAPPAPAPARPTTKPVRSETKAPDVAKARKPETPVAESPAASPGDASAASRFTVQVGSFKTRAQAEALRARLAETGQDAYVSEVEVAGVAQYRVRVGSFATREAARDAATRLAGERRMTTYVTTR
jgi:cell division protein FtsN